MENLLPILTFHSIDDSSSVLSFPPRLFRYALSRLDANGYTSISLMQAVEHIRRQEPFPARSFVITFDDGYQSVFREAFPVLQRYGMTATVFLTVGKPTNGKTSERFPCMSGKTMLSWKEVFAMYVDGITFGAHTLTHPNLTKIKDDAIRSEICDSKQTVEDRLGTRVDCFAYPFGCYNARVRKVVQQFFACGCSDYLDLADMASDVFALQRVDAYYFRGRRLFDLMFSRKLSLYIWTCNLLRSTRRALSNRCNKI